MIHRILHIIPGLGRGGAERQLVLNLSALDRERFENYVCYLYPRKDYVPAITSLGVQVFGLDLRYGRYQWPYAVARVRQLIRRLGIHLVHTSNFEAEAIGGLAARFAGVPAVSTLTSVIYEPEQLAGKSHAGRLKLLFTTKLRGAILRQCYHSHIAISETVRRSAVRNLGLPEERVRVIYRAINDDWFAAAAPERVASLRQELGVDGAFPILINAGRLIPAKGQRYLIEAVAQAIERFPQMRLLIAGQGYLQQSLVDTRNRLGLQDHVMFLGKRSDVKQLLDISDLFVFPSIYEGFGNALLEAASSGKPCIASDIGPFREILEHNRSGLLVAPQDPDAIAGAVQVLASNPALAHNLGKCAADSVKKRFRITHTIKQLEALYQEALS